MEGREKLNIKDSLSQITFRLVNYLKDLSDCPYSIQIEFSLKKRRNYSSLIIRLTNRSLCKFRTLIRTFLSQCRENDLQLNLNK